MFKRYRWIHTDNYDATPHYRGILWRGHLIGIEIAPDAIGVVWGNHFYGYYWGTL